MKTSLDNNHTPPVEEIHLALLQALPDGMCFVDVNGAIRFWNDAAESISGFSVAEAVCAPQASQVFFLSDTNGQPAEMPSGVTDAPCAVGCFLRHKGGHSVPIALRRLVVLGQNALPIGTLNLFAVPEGALKLRDASSTRPPWLRNDSSDQNLLWLHEDNRPVAVLVIQIDDFETVEHKWGPEAAEKVLALVELTVANCLRPDDACKRLSGGVFLSSIRSATKLSDLAERMRALIQSARLQWWGETLTITVSIGAAIIEQHDTVADAVRRAEDFTLSARANGGNQVVLAHS